METDVKKGLPENLTQQAAALLLNALDEKFIPILGDKEKAIQLLAQSIQHEHCFYIAKNGELQGLLAYQMDKKTFLSPKLRAMISLYGLFKGLLKFIGLVLLFHHSKSDEVYIEAVAVDERFRGKGIGSALMEAVLEFTRSKAKGAMTLEVIDTNPDAQRLYERLGFNVTKRSKLWPINKIIGWPFSEVIFMKKEL